MLFGRNDAKAETPVLLPERFDGQKNLAGPLGHKESDTTEHYPPTHKFQEFQVIPSVDLKYLLLNEWNAV